MPAGIFTGISASNDAAAERRRENNSGMIATEPSAIFSMPTRTLLCMSTLRIDASVIGALFRETRVTGESTGIKGAIVSDGERVAHVLHGVPERVTAMLAQILADERLADVTTSTILDAAHDDGTWLISGWTTGWATPELIDAFVADSVQETGNPLAPCMQLLLQCDLL